MAQSVDQPGQWGSRRRWTRGDITPTGSPGLSVQQWSAETAESVDRLRAWAEAHVLEVIGWYLRDKQVKRWSSRLLRAAAVWLAAAGGVVPILRGGTTAGYVLLALAAACVAFDHFFGLSSGWMRDITTARALQTRLTTFQLDWASWQAGEAGVVKPGMDPAGGADDAAGVPHALRMVDGLLRDVTRLAETETAQWVSDFHSSMANLRRQTGPAGNADARDPVEDRRAGTTDLPGAR